MYDPRSADRIRRAPPIGGLDISSLPQRFTQTHTLIASLRVQIAEGSSGGDAFQASIDEVRRLASAYEVAALLYEDSADREASAFVSASAHRLVQRAEESGLVDRRAARNLDPQYVGPKLSAMLLYLAGGYASDAAEIASELSTEGEDGIESVLVRILADLGQGRLERATLHVIEHDGHGPFDSVGAVRSLWTSLAQAVRDFARSLLDPSETDLEEDSIARLEAVRHMSSQASGQLLDDQVTYKTVDSFPGPHHLAGLLLEAFGRLRLAALTRLPRPPGVDGGAWGSFLSSLARRRPFLWPNHLEAVVAGYLVPGTSAVVSFPTGGGKTTLAELKAAAALLRGKKVVLLEPTHALVWQQQLALRETFAKYDVSDTMSSDGPYADLGISSLADIVVMTPERCLLLVSMLPDLFENVGLVVFDECHLLHSDADGGARRSIDAMLCLLSLLDAAADADCLLLSAMISNADDLSSWLGEITGRPCLPLTVEWKPTRQVRGCVVYDNETVKTLQSNIQDAQIAAQTIGKPKAPDKATKQALQIQPYGFFSLNQTWGRTVEDYSHLPLSTDSVQLDADLQWRLRPNTNRVAASLACRLSRAGMKTLVFVERPDYASMVAEAVAQEADRVGEEVSFLPVEQRWYDAAALDLGSSDAVMSNFGDCAVQHHSLLLPCERRLNESLFSRTDGVGVMVATPTLAQGMNLPVDAVVLAGDARFDQASGRQARLGPHEMLNAAGRAGRAGFNANGFVLIVPGEVIAFDATKSRIVKRWTELRDNVFSKSDQCLEVEDPIGHLLDRIELGVDDDDDRDLRYFVHRLPVSNDKDGGASDVRRLLGRSFAAYQSRQAGTELDFDERIERAAAARARRRHDSEPAWIDGVVTSTGISTDIVAELAADLESVGLDVLFDTMGAMGWILEWLETHESAGRELLSPRCLASGLGSNAWKQYEGGNLAWPDAITSIESRLIKWVQGRPLSEIEATYGGRGKKSAFCQAARRFIKDVPLDIAYVAGLVTQIRRNHTDNLMRGGDPGICLATLSTCIREGVDSPAMLALRMEDGPYSSRVATHAKFAEIESEIGPTHRFDNFVDVRRKVRSALAALGA